MPPIQAKNRIPPQTTRLVLSFFCTWMKHTHTKSIYFWFLYNRYTTTVHHLSSTIPFCWTLLFDIDQLAATLLSWVHKIGFFDFWDLGKSFSSFYKERKKVSWHQLALHYYFIACWYILLFWIDSLTLTPFSNICFLFCVLFHLLVLIFDNDPVPWKGYLWHHR